jgi:hypothetical protein
MSEPTGPISTEQALKVARSALAWKFRFNLLVLGVVVGVLFLWSLRTQGFYVALIGSIVLYVFLSLLLVTATSLDRRRLEAELIKKLAPKS